MIGIYTIKNIVTNYYYIGKSMHLENRFKQHFKSLNENKHYNLHLQRSFNKYGIQNFKWFILEYCDSSKLDEKEKFWIKLFKDNNFKLYNICEGGEGGKMPLEIIESNKIKISKANKGKDYVKHIGSKNGMYGKHHSFQSKQKMSLNSNNKGINNPMYGKHHSEQTKQKISKSLRSRYCSHEMSSETKKKMSEKAKQRAKNPIIYKILCNNLSKKSKYETKFIKQLQVEFNQGSSIRYLSKKYNLPYESTRQLIYRKLND